MEKGVSVVGSLIGLIYLIVIVLRKSDEDNAFVDQYLSNVVNVDESIRPLLPYIIALAIVLLIESVYSWIIILSLYQEFTNKDHKVEDSLHTTYTHQNVASLFDYGRTQNAYPMGNKNVESLFDYGKSSNQMSYPVGKVSSQQNSVSLFADDYAG